MALRAPRLRGRPRSALPASRLLGSVGLVSSRAGDDPTRCEQEEQRHSHEDRTNHRQKLLEQADPAAPAQQAEPGLETQQGTIIRWLIVDGAPPGVAMTAWWDEPGRMFPRSHSLGP
jgi:hypothetical protein